MSFEVTLAGHAQDVERYLDGLLSADANSGAPDRLLAAMRHAVLGGGKRFRPFLLIEASRLLGLRTKDALPAAAALELVHCYSLVHDDLPAMDDDDTRRGRPTVHIAYDEATAILAGDALMTMAFEVLARPDCHPDPAVRCDLMLGLAQAAGLAGMAGGQMLDLEAERRPPDTDGVLRLQALKTGALITFACEAGAMLGKGTPDQRRALVGYGRALGLAFQISDDLLDAQGDATVIGKAVGKDDAAGKATLVSRLGLDGARSWLRAVVEEAEAALAPFGARATRLCEAVRWMAERRR